MYQIKILKGRNKAAEKRFAEIFGADSSNRMLRFSKLDLDVRVIGCNHKSAVIIFKSDNPAGVRKLSEVLSKNFRGMSVLLAQVEPKKWFSGIQVIEYRDGKIRNTLEGRGMTSSTVSEAIEAYRLHRELAE